MDAERSWYYLNQSQQVGPFSRDELRLLLAKELITANTLVWSPGNNWCTLCNLPDETKVEPQKQRQKWRATALAACVFFIGISVVVETPPARGFKIDALLPRGQLPQVRLDKVAYEQNAPPLGLAASRPHPPMLAQAFHGTGAGVSGKRQLVQEFWRSFANSDVVARYQFYLRHYPSGPFAEMATARINELWKRPKQDITIVNDNVVKKKGSSPTSKSKKLGRAIAMKNTQPAKRCWKRKAEPCRDRCRIGKARVCRDSRRLGT